VATAVAACAWGSAAHAANPAPKWFSYDRAAAYGSQSGDVMVPMRDGAQLACTLYLPTANGAPAAGPVPALVNNVEPYTRAQNDGQDSFFAKHGYVVMSCDSRGAKGSIAAGPFIDPFSEAEQHDMYDLIEWMAAQPWSNGDVGVAGYSYGAILAYLAAAQRPPHLRAVSARASYASAYRDIVYLGGIRGLDVQGWEFGLVTNSTANATYRQHPLLDAFWRERDIDTKYGALRAGGLPILDYGGWYDIYQDAAPANYMALRDQTWLVMGPGAHLDAAAVPDNALLAWFDHWMLKLPGAPLPDDKVISYEMPQINGAAGHGLTVLPDWPPPTTGAVRLRFNADGTLAERPGPKGAASYPVDPSDGGVTYWSHGYSEVEGYADQRPQEAKRLLFTTPVLDRDVVVAGATETTLRAALSAADGNLVVRLTDVAPSGASILVATGWRKASHRLGHDRVVSPQPGRAYDYAVHVWPTHWRFPKGHRIRLSVSSGDVPRIEPDAPPGTVELATGDGGSYADLPVLGAAPSAAGGAEPTPTATENVIPAPSTAAAAGTALGLPSARRCASRRRFRVHVRAPAGEKLRTATLYVGGRRAARVRAPRRTSVVDLRGLPRGTVRVRIVVRTRSGHRFSAVRRYRTCVY
jgi:predicted acyl esterase